MSADPLPVVISSGPPEVILIPGKPYRAKGCKVAFGSRAAAEAALLNAQRMRESCPTEKTESRVYYCKRCKFWHLTSAEEKQ